MPATSSHRPRLIPGHGHAGVEEAVNAFSLLRDYFEGAIIVDAESRITWIDQRYRELLKLAPDFDPASVEMRVSKKSRYLSLTCTVRATSRGQLDELYQALCDHPLVVMVL